MFSTIGLNRRIQVSGKILRKSSDETFTFADAGEFCELRIETKDQAIKSRQLKLLHENECVTLVDPQVAKDQKAIAILDCTTVMENDEEIEVDAKFCEGCGKITDSASLLKHVSHRRQCKIVYGDRYIEMLNKSKKETQKKKYSNDIAKYSRSNQSYYQKNKASILEKSKTRNAENRKKEESKIEVQHFH